MSWSPPYRPGPTPLAPTGDGQVRQSRTTGRFPTEPVGSFTQGPNTGFPRSFDRNWDVTALGGPMYVVPVAAGWRVGAPTFRAGGIPTFRPGVGPLESYDYSQHPEAWLPANPA